MPDALLVVHPECPPEIIDLADCVESTSGMVRLAKESKNKRFLIGTEEGLIKRELDPALSALTFMAIHHGVLHQWVLNRYKLEGRDYVKTFRKILMDGLKA